jgi:type II secretory pathway component PulC
MQFEKNQITFIALPFILIFFSIVISSLMKIKPVLSPTERELSRFSYEKLRLIDKQPLQVTKLNSPVKMPVHSQKDILRVPISGAALHNETEAKRISLILISDGLKMAIIDGTVVNEGDVINDCRIVKIEKDKILLKDQAGEEWIKIE